MRAAVIDDEPLARSGVIARLAEHMDVQIAGEFGDGASALAAMTYEAVDVAFVDVQMPGMTGLELLAALPRENRPLAIMLTAYDSFAIRAFELRALDYLLKPLDDARFAEALDRARQALPWHRGTSSGTPHSEGRAVFLERFTVRVGAKIVLVDADTVDWIEADGDYAALHAGNDTYLVREPLHALARLLDPKHFVRVHRSAIVRLDRVVELKALANRDALIRLRNGTPLRASRTYMDALSAALGV